MLIGPPASFDLLAQGVAVELRAFVREAGRRRALPFTAYVGVPGSATGDPPASFDHLLTEDPVFRADLVERVVDGLEQHVVDRRRACAWVTRPGELLPETRDLAWLAAARTGFARHGLELPAFFVLGRYGWHELTTGQTREWARVRSYRERRRPSSGPWVG